MRVAVVHDWLYVVGGAERVLAEILACFPQADVFSLFDFLSDEDRRKIGLGETRRSFLQKAPLARRFHRHYLPLMPLAVEQFDFSGYDLVISSSYAVAKGVVTGPGQAHVSYVHSPMRYAWDLQNEYLRQSGADRGLKSVLARLVLHYMRIWDTRTAAGPDLMIANSAFVARRIRKFYGRDCEIIHPPVALSPYRGPAARGDYFFAASRLVPYKNIDVVVEAFSRTPELKLIVAGDGPQADKIRKLAGPNVEMRGFVSDRQMRELMAGARAFIFAAEEDFGIIPVEAQAEGTPVLALGRGGALETVVASGPNRTGLFFDAPTPDSIEEALRRFVESEAEFSSVACRAQAEKFSAGRFRRALTGAIANEMERIARGYPSLAEAAGEAEAAARGIEQAAA